MTAPRPERPEDVRIEQHLGLVHTVIQRGRYVRAGVDREDMAQECAIAMLRARELWDPALSAWSTYAGMWARQACGRYVANHAVAVRVPVHRQEKRIAAGELPRPTVFSLDRTLGNDEEGKSHLDMISYPEPENDRDGLPDTTLEDLIAATPDLTSNEVRVLRLRASAAELKLEQAGTELGVCRERARQLELSAMVKVRRANGIEVDDDLEARHERLRGYRSPSKPQATPDKAPALKVELTGDVERDVASLRAQGLGLRAVAKLLGISCHAVQAIERKLLARLAALESAA